MLPLSIRFVAALALLPTVLAGQTPRVFTHADTVRGSNTTERAWWDAEFYDLHVRVNPADKSVRGYNAITYRVLEPASTMQLDLQRPLEVDSMVQRGERLQYRRDGNAFFVSFAAPPRVGAHDTITVYYHGSFVREPGDTVRRPNPFQWAADSSGGVWFATSVEGPGASTWWPLKDFPADEPDSQRIAITVPDPLIDVSNGRLRSTTHNPDSTTTYEWFVADPINSYDVAVNANAGYVVVRDTFTGEQGPLTLEFWPLARHRQKAEALMPQVKQMLACHEHWFGPYPWYADGYKLIEVPYLGMEHQSGIAYGNQYLPGYLGRDLSGTGEGLTWDYIIVHESAHEWWGNSVSAKDHADMWIHESFGMYAEALYLECANDRGAAERYLVGARKMIQNDVPIIGTYGVYDVPRSQDRYPKGANMLMTMRAVVHDDVRWLATLRGLQQTFQHQTVTASDVRDYMSRTTGTDLSKIFSQYLETTKVPVLEYRFDGRKLWYRWNNVIAGFAMPVDGGIAANGYERIRPTEHWQSSASSLPANSDLRVDPAYYITTVRADAP